jgi:hypothetical protein
MHNQKGKKMTEEKRQVILDAVDAVKRGNFKATAIKVELEAQLNRNTAQPISGTVEDSEECDSCNGSGNCDCGGYDCSDSCEDCAGTGLVPGTTGSWQNEIHCQDHILEQLVPLGLAVERTEQEIANGESPHYHRHGGLGKYKEAGALKFGEFYRDGSVDSEFTFTVMLDNPENIFLVPKIIEIFAKLATDMGTQMDVAGAGMHTAFINHPEGLYGQPGTNTANPEHMTRFRNFRKSMSMLLPALFFLASDSDRSRRVGYREPRVSDQDKYSAIAYRLGAIEFRVFETCYDNPEQILDNFVVMKNCMRYWSRIYKSPGIDKKISSLYFGNDLDNKLERFYTTIDHLTVLNMGLQRLKPSYLSIKELKTQRKFTMNKRRINNIVVEQTQQAEVEYKEYEERFNWCLLSRRNRLVATLTDDFINLHNGRLTEQNKAEALAAIERKAEEQIVAAQANKKQLQNYITEKINHYNEARCGRWALTA